MSEFQSDGLSVYEYYLQHRGTPHEGMTPHSGRFQWGSGENPYQHEAVLSVAMEIKKLRAKGMSDQNIAAKLGIVNKWGKPSTKKLRDIITLANDAETRGNVNRARALYNEQLTKTGKANVSEIARQMGTNESNVRNWIKKYEDGYKSEIENVSEYLKQQLKEVGWLDVGAGVEKSLGIADTRLDAVLTGLELEGYKVHEIKVPQVTTNHKTTMLVLTPGDVQWSEVMNNTDKIQTIVDCSPDGCTTIWHPEYPVSIDSSRLAIKYAEDGGTDKDGVIEIRRGVPDLSLGESNYAQVRIAVDDKLYLKGMAVYSDNVPEGKDILFNTNKSNKKTLGEVLKEMKSGDNPFGATIKAEGQYHYIGPNGEELLGAINKVNEEGDWGKWSKTLSTQFLSKQPQALIKQQIDLSVADRQDQLDTIMSVTNPVIRQQMLIDFGDSCDRAAAELKTIGLPGQASHVILPVTSLKPNEIYAPNYIPGSHVVLIRYPHGGIFEIPELVVTDKNREAKKMIGNSGDAVGIHPKAAAQLSGADFDGDTVLVIPVAGGTGKSTVKVLTAPALEELKGFDPKVYELPPDAPKVTNKTKQLQMGRVTNLITDMSFQDPTNAELARAVRHSMVVIDSEKHHLNWEQSEKDNDIQGLMDKYQIKPGAKKNGGASTIISRSDATNYIDEVADNSRIDPETGKRVYRETGGVYSDAKGAVKKRQTKVSGMSQVDDAMELVSPNRHPVEILYADYANTLKKMATESRKAALSIKLPRKDPNATRVYATEVASLNKKLNDALMNAPRERMAQLYAKQAVKAAREQDPEYYEDKDHYKKLKSQKLTSSRAKFGAKKPFVTITEEEAKAINAGAIGSDTLKKIYANSDKKSVEEAFMPKRGNTLSSSKINMIKMYTSAGYTAEQIAERLNISVSAVNKYKYEK